MGDRERAPRTDREKTERPPRDGDTASNSGGPADGRRRQDRDKERERAKPAGDDGKVSLLVRNLSRKTTSEEIKKFFEQYGVIKDVYLPKDYYSGCGAALGGSTRAGERARPAAASWRAVVEWRARRARAADLMLDRAAVWRDRRAHGAVARAVRGAVCCGQRRMGQGGWAARARQDERVRERQALLRRRPRRVSAQRGVALPCGVLR
jgi:hypothetical protein